MKSRGLIFHQTYLFQPFHWNWNYLVKATMNCKASFNTHEVTNSSSTTLTALKDVLYVHIGFSVLS